MRKIRIEEAKKSDAKRILHIQKEAYRSEAEIYDDYKIPPLTQTLSEIESDFDSHNFYVAKLNEEIIGSVNLKVESNIGFIGRLIVIPKMQNLRIGTMLMDYAESSHTNLDAFELFTGHRSIRNLTFYRKRGYIEFKRQPVHDKLVFVFLRKKVAGKPIKNDP